jgi:hypothetical protein
MKSLEPEAAYFCITVWCVYIHAELSIKAFCRSMYFEDGGSRLLRNFGTYQKSQYHIPDSYSPVT